ncbi:reverse transcriptase family protein [Kibdelosporangium persicum]|uniref:reverse transcriptase family protein n=1 Tax=Kibdelosporangium persicum TaxID=2698649 RepID=UPI0028A8B79C|nr:reverse transcriptase family protein [Kibdelosporangium persicum]
MRARGHRENESLRVAASALDGPWTQAEIATRLMPLYVDPAAAEVMADRLVSHSPRAPFGGIADLARLIAAFPPITQAPAPPPKPKRSLDIAGLLDVTPSELDWLADARGWNKRAGKPLWHYRSWWTGTSTGGLRLIEAPKPRLAEAQRRLVRHLGLPVHEAAHGFRKGRSGLTYAAPHSGKPVVVRMDLEGFFASVTGARVRALLHEYAQATTLAGLLTTRAPLAVLRDAPKTSGDPDVRRRLLAHLAHQHLPQGAPSSPAVANAVAYRLDLRLSGLARALGAHYTRYADDLAFSGPQTLPLYRLLPGVAKIAREEGFRVRPDKTSVTGQHQRQKLAGLVVNASPAAPRAAYDELKALLHNCRRTGPQAQNRAGHPDFQAHVRGRIDWVAAGHPARGAKLRALFGQIDW